jgi:menaquinone-specific isochorismate synthase
MAQLNGIESNSFWRSGFVVQIHEDLFFLGNGPFKDVNLNRSEYSAYIQVNDLLIKPDYWSFLDGKSANISGLKPTGAQWLNRKEFHDLVFDSLTNSKLNRPDLNTLRWENNFKTNFEMQFNQMQILISQSRLEKAVPIGVIRSESDSSLSPQYLIQNLLESPTTTAWIYGFWNQDNGFIGQTPEILFQSITADHLNKVNTMALAGTWPNKMGIKNDYNDPKIWNEHLIVVKDIKQQLKNFECIFQSETEIIKLKNLAHLKTNLEFKIEKIDQNYEVLNLLHPTAALGIFPRDEKIYKSIQNLPLQNQRRNFGAPFGVLSKNISQVVVGIRNVFWNHRNIELFAGCGITNESIFPDEYNEVIFKMESVKKMLGLMRV